MQPPVPLLSGQDIDSFAYITIKDRMPAILSGVVNDLAEDLHRNDRSSSECENIKAMMSSIGQLRHDITRNKNLPLLKDKYWKELLVGISEPDRCWFNAPWLITECLMYKLLQDISVTYGLVDQKPRDLFSRRKMVTLESSISSMHSLAHRLKNAEQDADSIKDAISYSLWGNQHDLSLNVDKSEARNSSHILVDDSEILTEKLLTSRNIVMILDNSGFELFCDFWLAAFLSKNGCKVTFHMKDFPWFVSDTTAADVEQLFETCESDPDLTYVANLFKTNFECGTWILASDPFWTTGNSFWDLPKLAPDLMNELKAYDLVLFKGDLNYRKVVYDACWPVTTPFEDAIGPLKGQLKMAFLRTVKSETCVGLSPEMQSHVNNTDPKWMVNGLWGIVQYHQ